MTNNDVIRSIRYILNVSDKKIADIFALTGKNVTTEEVQDMLKDEEHPDYLRCDDLSMAHFLDGLIYFRRGRDDSKPAHPFELPISNNLILKKLRVAFALKEPDMHEVMSDGGYNMGRSELTALLRKKGQPNYRECGDQVLRYFLKGLAAKFRK
jgi:uncharacterized protein YehS (DUF1456 family)